LVQWPYNWSIPLLHCEEHRIALGDAKGYHNSFPLLERRNTNLFVKPRCHLSVEDNEDNEDNKQHEVGKAVVNNKLRRFTIQDGDEPPRKNAKIC
jgi:hypothetical protein